MDFTIDGPTAIPMWVNGHAFLTVTSDYFMVTDPKTGEGIRRIPLCGAEEAAEAAVAARAAQPAWADMGLMPRRVCLGKLADGLDRYTGHFAKLLVQETGCDEAAGRAEVEAAVALLRDCAVGDTGCIGIVLDAVSPLLGFVQAAAPALLAGATVVVKPSPKAAGAVFALCELTARSEWPGGVVNLLQGDSAALDGLCAAGLDRIVYRGQDALGEQVAARALAAGAVFVRQA
jgi:acyl-CoA reductase-like NAD-dependent aldehyde dehydrogenase